jgi:phage protein D
VGLKPVWQLIANGADVTATIRERFISLTLTEETGSIADTLEIELADHLDQAPIAVPDVGAELQLGLGYDDAVTQLGKFVMDEIEMSGWPARMRLRARAAPYTQSTSGYKDLQSQKTRSWPKGITIGAMVKKMASEHGMTAMVSADLAGIALPQTDQTSESDLNLLLRLAKNYDAVAKPAAGKLVFARRGTGQSVTGQALPVIAGTPGQVSSYSVTKSVRAAPGTVVAGYHSVRKGERHEVSAGSGDPVRRIKGNHPDQASALAAAKAELVKDARKQNKLSLSLPGDPAFGAEALLTLSGFRAGVDRTWLVDRVTHRLGEGGYTCTIDASLPNSDADVQPHTSPTTADRTVSSPGQPGAG